jgi:hypothetical protein
MFSGGNSIKVFGLLVFVAHLVFESTVVVQRKFASMLAR